MGFGVGGVGETAMLRILSLTLFVTAAMVRYCCNVDDATARPIGTRPAKGTMFMNARSSGLSSGICRNTPATLEAPPDGRRVLLSAESPRFQVGSHATAGDHVTRRQPDLHPALARRAAA